MKRNYKDSGRRKGYVNGKAIIKILKNTPRLYDEGQNWHNHLKAKIMFLQVKGKGKAGARSFGISLISQSL